MKAITQDNRVFNVRFRALSLFELGYANEKQWWCRSAEIEIAGVWYYATIEVAYMKGEEKVMCVLSKSACKALNVEPVNKTKRIAIWLDAIPEQEWIEFYQHTKKQFVKEANKACFTYIKIRHNSIVGWDASIAYDYAQYNDVAQDMLLTFNLAEKANQEEMYKYVQKGDVVVDYMFTYTIRKSDLEQLQKIAEPERVKYEEQKKQNEMLKQRKAERETNIKNGAIYFHCESAPHDEDLSKVILARPCPNGGSFVLTHRIGKNIFDAIKEFGVYWDDEFLEECDMFFSAPGWRFTYHAIDRLRKLNHRVFVDYVEVTD